MNELCERVEAWRKQEGGGPGKRVPDELWEQAVRVARVDGLTATARATHLNYDRLKQRSKAQSIAAGVKVGAVALRAVTGAGIKPKAVVHGRRAERETGCEEGAGFVALQVAPRPSCKQTTIELTGRHGERMRVEFQGELDLSSLVHAFRSMQS
jgi:uncharacterized protein (UPF0218 family)